MYVCKPIDPQICLTTNTFPIGKGKAIPVQAYSGSEGPGRLKLPEFKIIRI